MVDYRVALGDVLSVDYAVENQGETVGDQDIELLVASTQEDSDTGVVVDVGVTETGTLEWDTAGATAQEYTVSVESADTSDQFTLEVVDPTNTAFYLVDIDSTNSPILDKDTLDVTATIENVGDQSGTQDISLDIDGTQEDSITGKSLAAGASETVELNWDAPSGSAGEKTAQVNSADDFDDVTITVEQGSGFKVTIDQTNEPITEGDTLNVTATIENTGLSQDTQFITLDIDNSVGTVDSTDVTLAPDSAKTVVLEWDTQDGDGGITYTATVSSLDDSDTASVAVDKDPTNSTGLTKDWSVSISNQAEITSNDNIVYAWVNDDDLFAYNADQSLKWQTSKAGVVPRRFYSTNDGLYHTRFENIVEKSSLSDGSTEWSVSGDQGTLAVDTWVVSSGTDTGDSIVILRERSTGDILLQFNASFDVDDAVATEGNMVFVKGNDGQRLDAYEITSTTDQNGNTTYSETKQWTNDSFPNLSSEMIANDGKVFVAEESSLNISEKVYGIDSADGSILWSTTFGGARDIRYYNGLVLVATSNNTIAYQASDGQELWSANTGPQLGIGVSNGSVYSDEDGDKLSKWDLTF